MKYLLLFPPAWPPIAPYLSIPCLLGQLKKEGFKAEAIDLNIEFYNDILKKSYLEKSIKNLQKIQAEVSIESKQYDIENRQIEDYPIEIKEVLLKNKKIQEYLHHKSGLLTSIPKNVEKAVSNIKNQKKFYDPKILMTSSKTITSALEIASLPYAPAKIGFNGYSNPLYQPNYENIKYHVFSTSTNMFIEYYKKWLPIIKRKNPKCIGISIGAGSQIIAGLTLANLLKTHTDAHINIGGNYFSRITDSFQNCPDFFELFADSISIDEGETPIVELAKYICGKSSIENVPNLIYKKNNKIIVNEICNPIELGELPTPCYDGYKFSKYLTPKVVLPVQTTRSCYWGKCTFCDLSYGKKHSTKNVDVLVKELKEYKKKYGINTFEIIDDSISPKYYKMMAEKIIESKLNINYCSFARTELAFTEEILDKARQSGLRMILWGLESGSERIFKLINKGVDFNKRFEVLKRATNADIWNHGFILFGFPSETIEEVKETIEMIYKNSDVINSYGSSFFQLGKHSIINKNKQEYEIKSVDKRKDDFSCYESTEMTNEEKFMISQLNYKKQNEIYALSLWRYILTQEYLLLYIIHHGAEWVKNYKVNNI